MDDLIIIILTFIIAAAGMIGQIRKKKQQQPETNGKPQNSSDNFWEFLDDLSGEPQRQEVVAPPPEPPKTTEIFKEQPKYAFNAENEGQRIVDTENDLLKDDISQPPDNKRKERISDTFSLRKAVIYSEILNRKYT